MCAAHAGNISFRLALTDMRLTLVNAGDSVAFFPAVLAMQPDGRWQALSPPTGEEAPALLSPGERLELLWPEAQPPDKLSAFARLRPTMVRFFDEAGAGFGQISFFAPPPDASVNLAAGYAQGALRLLPPPGNAIRSTWVLWPQQEGIAGLRQAFSGGIVQPPAQRIEWRADMTAAQMLTGAAQPPVILIHETALGYQLQRVAAGLPDGKEQRAAWLDAGRLFYALALAFAAVAAGAMRWQRGVARA